MLMKIMMMNVSVVVVMFRLKKVIMFVMMYSSLRMMWFIWV